MSTEHRKLDKEYEENFVEEVAEQVEPEQAEFGVEELGDIDDIEEIGAPVEPKFGVVSNCVRLNVRTEPNINSEILCMVDAGVRLMIDPANSNEGWFNVFTNAGIEGYCMKEYVEIEE